MAKFKISRPWSYALTYLYVVLGYLITNHLGTKAPHLLSFSFIDSKTPFLPWTAWIYVTVYFIPILSVIYVKEEEDIRAMIKTFLMASTIGFIVFLIYPTVYPRPSFEHTGFLTFPLWCIHSLDAPTNCWPSLHVVYAFLTAFFIRPYNSKLGNLLLVWAVCISVSTLTVKQHYAWDVIAGYALARLMHRIGTIRQVTAQ